MSETIYFISHQITYHTSSGMINFCSIHFCDIDFIFNSVIENKILTHMNFSKTAIELH